MDASLILCFGDPDGLRWAAALGSSSALRKMRRSFKVKSVAIVGIIVATYALYVENRLLRSY